MLYFINTFLKLFNFTYIFKIYINADSNDNNVINEIDKLIVNELMVEFSKNVYKKGFN